MQYRMDELLVDLNEYSSRFKNWWDFESKYKKDFGKMLASLK